jgi:hypothetical protein
MKQMLPWVLAAFFSCFFIFQQVGYNREKQHQERIGTIEGQAELLSEWLDLTPQQQQAYYDFRLQIVAKEKEFQDFRKQDAKEFFEANRESMTAEEKLHAIKERHLKKLMDTKNAELELWSGWIDELTFEQRRKYLGKVFEYRPLDASWYDRDFFDDL